jgi:hypothetical protein
MINKEIKMSKTNIEVVADPVDVRGKKFTIGCKIARAAKMFQTDGLYIEICTVTDIKNGKVYLDSSARPIRFADRVAIVD